MMFPELQPDVNHPYIRHEFISLKLHAPPLPFGVYSRLRKQNIMRKVFRQNDFQSGYNWYRLFSTKLEPGMLVFYCFKSWCVQADVSFCFDSNNKDAVYTFYLRAKFTGKLYGGSENDPNVIYLDRLIIVREK